MIPKVSEYLAQMPFPEVVSDNEANEFSKEILDYANQQLARNKSFQNSLGNPLSSTKIQLPILNDRFHEFKMARDHIYVPIYTEKLIPSRLTSSLEKNTKALITAKLKQESLFNDSLDFGSIHSLDQQYWNSNKGMTFCKEERILQDSPNIRFKQHGIQSRDHERENIYISLNNYDSISGSLHNNLKKFSNLSKKTKCLKSGRFASMNYNPNVNSSKSLQSYDTMSIPLQSQSSNNQHVTHLINCKKSKAKSIRRPHLDNIQCHNVDVSLISNLLQDSVIPLVPNPNKNKRSHKK